MKLSDAFGTDEEAEQEGKWFPLSVNGEEARFRIAHFRNANMQKYARKHLPRGSDTDSFVAGETTTTEEEERIVMKGLAKHVLLDWENVEEDGGEELEYSEEHAIQMMEQFPHFRRWVVQKSMDLSNFQNRQEEDDKKN